MAQPYQVRYWYSQGISYLNGYAEKTVITIQWGEIFFLCYDDVRDIELSGALNKLVAIIADGLANGKIQMEKSVRGEILNWYISQPNFIQSICQKQMEDAGLLASIEHNGGEMSTGA